MGLAILGGSLLGRLFAAMKRETGTVIEYITQGDAGIRRVEQRDNETYFKRNPREIKDIYGLVLHQMAFDYGKHLPRKPIVAAAVIRHGMPYLEVMPMGKTERYHKRVKK